MNFKRIVSKYPYLLPLLAGVLLFAISLHSKGRFSDLLVNLSASLLIIPIVIFLYEKIRERAEAEKNRDLSNYVKMQADRELLTLLGRIAPLVIGSPTPGLNEVFKLLSMTTDMMKKNLEEHSVMVFFLATDWAFTENAIRELVSSELTYNNLNVEERNNFIRLISAVRRLDIATEPRYFQSAGAPDKKYNVIHGKDMNPANKYENRYLLTTEIKRTGENIVAAFNDLNVGKYRTDYTMPMSANKDGISLLVEAIAEVLDCIEVWHKLRGNEFLLDSQHFKAFRNLKKQAK